LLRFGTASFAAVCDFLFPVHFSLAFCSACSSSPRIAPVLGETVAAIRAKARRTWWPQRIANSPALFWHAVKSIFFPMILFGEGFRLHYLYCMISALIDFDQGW